MLLNVLVAIEHFHGSIITGEQMLVSKSIQSSLRGLPQSTVVMAMYSNHFEGANLKQPKIKIVMIFFLQPVYSVVTRKVLCSKLPPVAREFSGGGAFALCFEHNCDITPVLFQSWGRVYYMLDTILSAHVL